MNKALIATIIIGILVTTMFFEYGQIRYQQGSTSGYDKGYKIGQGSGSARGGEAYQQGNITGYQQGYQAGLNAQKNGTG